MKKDNGVRGEIVKALLAAWDIRAVIFDLDGTLVDNNAFHLLAWKKYLEHAGIHIGDAEYRKHLNGRTNKDAIEYIFQRSMTEAEAMVFALEKEALYREIYAPEIKPVAGLIPLLEILQSLGIPMAIATSGLQVNIDFMFQHIPISHYFTFIVHAAHIKMGKPDPEIYVKAAGLLQVAARQCLVFEDAAVGIAAAKAAGMKVIALTTTQSVSELAEADKIIADFASGLLHA